VFHDATWVADGTAGNLTGGSTKEMEATADPDRLVIGANANKSNARIVKNRRMVTSPRRSLLVAAKVLLLFAGASVYFAVSFQLEYKEFNKQYVSMGEQAYAARRNTVFRDAGISLRDFMFSPFRSALFRAPQFSLMAGTGVSLASAFRLHLTIRISAQRARKLA